MALQMTSMLAQSRRELRQHPVELRVRAERDGTTVVDSYAARLVWEPRRIVSAYAVPVTDIAGTLVNPQRVSPDPRTLPPVLSPRQGFEVHAMAGTGYDIETAAGTVSGAAFAPDDPDLEGYVVLDWDAFTRWFEEGEEVRGHPREPFHSIRCLPSDRHVVVEIDGQVVADTHRAVMLVETSLPARWYIPRDDVRMDLLTPSDSHTICAYKGQASYWSYGDSTDVVWSYPDPRHEAEPVKDHLSFYAEFADYVIDGEPQEHPVTEWSRSRT
jgi:uncharacterized protein (DUF427 family)